jgi:hypothetical protein
MGCLSLEQRVGHPLEAHALRLKSKASRGLGDPGENWRDRLFFGLHMIALSVASARWIEIAPVESRFRGLMPLRPLPAPSFYVETHPGQFESTAATVGPWSGALQHGGPPCALLARALARLPGAPEGARLTRIAVEILSPVPVAPLTVEASVLRPGGKIALLEASASAGGKVVLRARAWRMTAAPGRSPEVERIEAPPFSESSEPITWGTPSSAFGYGDALEWKFAAGAMNDPGPATAWTRLRIPLVSGEEPSPVERMLTMLDAANGISAELDPKQWTFVPVDLIASLTRHPKGEWMAMAANTALGSEGIGLTRAELFDREGLVGRSLHTLWVEPR